MNRKILLALPVLLATSAAPAADEWPADAKPMAGDELRARLVGKSFTWKAGTARFTAKVQYDANGYAFINVSNGQNDSGRYKIDGSQLCSEWAKLPNACSEVRAQGDVLLLRRVDGTLATMTLN
jgi:hypothetical protein